MDRSVEAYFEGKPGSRAIFQAVAERIAALGPVEITVGTQIAFGAARKFAWFWLYNVTGKTPEGVPHLMLALDHRADSDHVRQVVQVSRNRWNHQIVLRTLEDARSDWLGDLLEQAYDLGSRERPA